MSEIRRDGTPFVGYEYKEIPAAGEKAAFYLDCCESFGWTADEWAQGDGPASKGRIVLRRERKIMNKMELTRLQRHFEACVDEIKALERSKTSAAVIWAILAGLTGTAFMAGSTFAVLHVPPLWVLSIVPAVPGFAGWALTYFLYRKLAAKRARVVSELVERKYDEIYEICEQGNKLLS